MLMTETYTKPPTPQGTVRKPDTGCHQLELDDELFYNFLKTELNRLLIQPSGASIKKITAYSKAWRTAMD